MKIIEKYIKSDFKGFSWLNFDYLPDSDGYKFEVYITDPDDIVSDLILAFYSLYKPFINEILISEFTPDGQWGDFCLDTWDIENDQYDYSPDNKEESSASYLAMLRDNEIEPNYSGFCKCLDWDKFLSITLNCVAQHTAPYSMMFYEPNNEFVFYFHHTGSFGVYYKELNNAVKSIIQKAKDENFEIKYINDERVVALINN